MMKSHDLCNIRFINQHVDAGVSTCRSRVLQDLSACHLGLRVRRCSRKKTYYVYGISFSTDIGDSCNLANQ